MQLDGTLVSRCRAICHIAGSHTVRVATKLSRILVNTLISLDVAPIALGTTSNKERDVHWLELSTTEVPVLPNHIFAVHALDNAGQIPAEIVRDGLDTSSCDSIVCIARSDTLFQSLRSVDTKIPRQKVSLL